MSKAYGQLLIPYPSTDISDEHRLFEEPCEVKTHKLDYIKH